MIKVKTKFSIEEDKDMNFSVLKYDIKDTNTIEHISLIIFLMEQIQKQDETMTKKDIYKLIDQVNDLMEGKENEERSNENE